MQVSVLVRGMAAGVVLLAAAACTATLEQGSLSTGTPPTLVIAPIGSPMPPVGDLSTPPGNLDPNLPGDMPVMGGSRDGIYSGVAVPLNTDGGLCINSQTIDDFIVDGDRVRWGRFRGRIRGDGLQMVQGNAWVLGRFDDNTFTGRIIMYGPRQTPGCSFMLRLVKTANIPAASSS